jgi:hypothetical protein
MESLKSRYHWILVIILVVTNVFAYQNNTWYLQQFNDNLVLTQNHFSCVKFTLMGILDAGTVTHQDLLELRKWAR